MSDDEFQDLTCEYPNAYLCEEVGEPLQAELVHGVHRAQVRHAEVEDGHVVRHLRFRNFTSQIEISRTLFKVFDQ